MLTVFSHGHGIRYGITDWCLQLFFSLRSARRARMCRCHVSFMTKLLPQKETLSQKTRNGLYHMMTKRSRFILGLKLKAHKWDDDSIQWGNGFGRDTSRFSRHHTKKRRPLCFISFLYSSVSSFLAHIDKHETMACVRSIGSLNSVTHSPRHVSRTSGTVSSLPSSLDRQMTTRNKGFI